MKMFISQTITQVAQTNYVVLKISEGTFNCKLCLSKTAIFQTDVHYDIIHYVTLTLRQAGRKITLIFSSSTFGYPQPNQNFNCVFCSAEQSMAK